MKERYAREIMSSFPYPVASSFVRLRTDECLDAGQLIGYFLTSNEDTEHLHFEVLHCGQKVDPKPLMYF